MRNRALAILGMDTGDPVLVGFVDRLGRQSVDQEIFGGAAVLDAVAEVVLETADAGDALDPGELRLAFLQRAMRRVALMRDFLQMPPEVSRSGSRAKSIVGAGHQVPAVLQSSVTQESRVGYLTRCARWDAKRSPESAEGGEAGLLNGAGETQSDNAGALKKVPHRLGTMAVRRRLRRRENRPAFEEIS